MQSPQSLRQLHLSPQQQQLLLQAQQNLASPSAGDVESRRLRMLLSNRNIVLGKDNQSSSVGDVPNFGSALPTSCPVLARDDTDLLIKVRYFHLKLIIFYHPVIVFCLFIRYFL